MVRSNREQEKSRHDTAYDADDFSGGYGKNFGADDDEDLGFFNDDGSWGSERLKSGVGRNDYGNNDVLKKNIGEGYFGKGPKGWKRSDERIREDVCEALYRDYKIDASDIDVHVKDACVYLKGTVNSRQTKKDVERVLEIIAGVKDVQNELRVRQEGEAITPEDPAIIPEDRDQQDSNTYS